jgi:hypothetical protein
MDTAQASPVAAWMAVSREQNDYPLVPRTVHGVETVDPAEDGARAHAGDLADERIAFPNRTPRQMLIVIWIPGRYSERASPRRRSLT